MKKTPLALLVLAGAGLSVWLGGCGRQANSDIGKVDVEHVVTQWPLGKKNSDQLAAAQSALEASAKYMDPKSRQDAEERIALDAARIQEDLAAKIRVAAGTVAKRDGLKYVVTRDYVGWGGRDITDEVLKELERTN